MEVYHLRLDPNSELGFSGPIIHAYFQMPYEQVIRWGWRWCRCDGPTERISCFVGRLIQPIAQQQESYLKDSKDFINTKLPKNTILASMDVTSLYTNIPQEEGITTVCKAYEDFYKNRLPIHTKFLRRMLCLILKENSFQFNKRHYLQTHGTAMGTKMAVAFANIFMAKIEKSIISKSIIKPLV